MEAGTAGTPAAAEQPTQTETTTAPPMPSMPQVESPTAPAPEQPQEPTDPNSEIISRLDSLKEEFDSLRQQPQPEAPAGGLMDALLGEPEVPEGEVQPDQPLTQEPGMDGFDENDPAFQAFNQYLDQAIEARVNERVGPMQEERLEEQFNALEKQYPDITKPEIVEKMSTALDAAARRGGNPALREDPYMVSLVYKAVKAEMADAAAVPAEQAATTGASIETGAGQSQAGEPSPADAYVQAIYGGATKKSAFQ